LAAIGSKDGAISGDFKELPVINPAAHEADGFDI